MVMKRKFENTETSRQSSRKQTKQTKQTMDPDKEVSDPITLNRFKERHAQIENVTGDALETASPVVIVHSCNCEASWGKGFAKALRAKFPDHHRRYQVFCKTHKAEKLLGTCLLLGPPNDAEESQKVWIGCLFTRRNIFRGPRKASPAAVDDILAATASSMSDLYSQMQLENLKLDIVMPRINSGLFQTPWERTADVLQSVTVPDDLSQTIKVYELG